MGVGSNTLYAADNPNYYMDSGDRNMTPEREDYLNNCSNREKMLRAFIADVKLGIKRCKKSLNDPKENFGRSVDLIMIRVGKVRLNAYRNELQRLNGMDRVVVPYEVMRFGFEANIPRVSYNCECFEPIDRKHKYCPNCGRRILWEKVK